MARAGGSSTRDKCAAHRHSTCLFTFKNVENCRSNNLNGKLFWLTREARYSYVLYFSFLHIVHFLQLYCSGVNMNLCGVNN